MQVKKISLPTCLRKWYCTPSMGTVTSQTSARRELEPRLRFLSEQFLDLLERDLKDSEERCFQRHVQRIWERLDPTERDAIRDKVDDPFSGRDLPACYLDSRCIRLIAEFLRGDQGCED